MRRRGSNLGVGWVLLWGAGLVLACGGGSSPKDGQTHPEPKPAERIVAIAPGVTEMLFVLGLGDRVVGVGDYARWPADSGRTAAASYEVTHALGIDQVTLDQRRGGGEWRLLGSYDFDPALGPATVALSGGPDGSLAADALRFVAAGGQDPGASYTLTDHLGRPRGATDTAGLLLWSRGSEELFAHRLQAADELGGEKEPELGGSGHG